MAKVILTTTGDIFYTIEHAVGPGCPNRTDDVLLVQFFLKVILQTMKTIPPIGIDGVFGPQTRDAIKSFQDEINKLNPGSLRPDGRIDPPTKGQLISTKSKNIYTIWALNDMIQKRGIALNSIVNHPDFPVGLRNSFLAF
jgi:peptidoglycan hydrolase-like protein with peptidoglycan-binding domain